jgi:hypothetical protein
MSAGSQALCSLRMARTVIITTTMSASWVLQIASRVPLAAAVERLMAAAVKV